MNNTLEGINSRLTEAEEQINDLEDRMVEIITREQNIEKRIKKFFSFPKRTLGQHEMYQHSHYRGLRRRRKDLKKYLKR